MTYNVHRCLGADWRLSPERIADVIAQFEPDVVALQELDVGRKRSRLMDQPQVIAERLRMQMHFHPAIRVAKEQYGDAILSRVPLRVIRAAPLPGLPLHFRVEQRGALWASISLDRQEVQIINTHLGLNRGDQLVQVRSLLGPDWLGDAACRPPQILCADLNARPGTPAHQRLSRVLRDAHREGHVRSARRTWPSFRPLVCVDYIFLSREFDVRRVDVPRTRLTRVASDHLPVIADVVLT
jgi:endonuclease/exonuclease/phosphatase family metal-dependent hydrolase